MMKAQCHSRECQVVVKVSTLDDPQQFGGPRMAIYTIDKQPSHQIPEGLPVFERLPQCSCSCRRPQLANT